MAHKDQKEFIENILNRFNEKITKSKNILEVGSQNINGTIKDYYPDLESKVWVGLDIGEGKDVDFTIPGELIQLPSGWADVAISSECFEHAENWSEIFLNMIRITHINSLIILTFAGKGRPAHGTIDSDIGSSPYTNSFYKNIDLVDFVTKFEIDKYFSKYAIEINHENRDTYFWGLRNNSYKDTELMSSEENLARVRGQLAMVIIKNHQLKHEISNIKSLYFKKVFLVIEKFIKRLRKLKNKN